MATTRRARTASAGKPAARRRKPIETGGPKPRKTATAAEKPAAKPAEKRAERRAEKSASKPAARKTVKVAAKKAAAKAPDPVVVSDAPMPEVTAPAMRKRAFVDKITERAGIKRRDAKAAAEAALAILGEAIAEGQLINLPGLGKMRVVRTKKLAHGRVFVTRIRQPDARTAEGPDDTPKAPKDPLAEAAE